MSFKSKIWLLVGVIISVSIATVIGLRKPNCALQKPEKSEIAFKSPRPLPIHNKLLSTISPPSTTHKLYPNDLQARKSCLSNDQLEPIRKTHQDINITFDPSLPIKRQVPLAKRLIVIPEKRSENDFTSSQIPTSRGTTPWIVMTQKDLQSDWAKAIPGVRIFGYLPHRAWLIEATTEGLKNIFLHPSVVAVEEWKQSDKTHPMLDTLSARLKPDDLIALNIHAIHHDDLDSIVAIIEKNGGKPINHIAAENFSYLHAATTIKTLPALVNLGAVQWLEEAHALRLCNDIAKEDNALYSSAPLETHGLTGEGQIIGHADSGIDTGIFATLHPDLTNGVVKITSYTSDGNLADYSGHGTHTAGSVVGDGTIKSSYKGTAPSAKMLSQCIIDANGRFGNFGLYTLFQDSYNDGARIHTDSWGYTSGYGEYLTDSREADRFTWNNPDFLPFFAAGNDASDSNSDGVIDANSIAPPGTAKNVITIGATESMRTSGGYSKYTYAAYNSTDNPSYPVDPILSDSLTKSADTVNNYRGMAAFSGRGPTKDGRTKPDLVSPGCDVVSCNSRTVKSGNYVYKAGTSMATPLAAGCGVQIRQYLCEHLDQSNPSGPLIKAMLISGAASLAPGQYGTNETQEIPFTYPNNVEGWGMIKVGNSISTTTRRIRAIDRISVTTSSPFIKKIEVVEEGHPLSIALSWTDYPATLGSGAILLDDLDLTLTCPDGTTIYPNSLTSADRINTTEAIKLTSANAGTYTLTVSAHTLPYPQTTAAVVIAGNLNEDTISSDLTTKLVDATNTNNILYTSTKNFDKTQSTSTDTAPSLIWVFDGEYSYPYVFSEWEIDGTRMPNSNATAYNPVTDIDMADPHTATAFYYPLNTYQYFYGNQYVFTWWFERIFNGSATIGELYWFNDNDGDGQYNGYEMFDNTDPNNPSDIPTKPQITVEALPTFIEERPPWAVYAEITDNFIVADAALLWKHKGDKDWTRTAMYDLGNDLWGAYLSPTNYGATRIDYCVVAADYLQYQLYEETTSTVYSVIGEYPNPWPSIEPASFPELTITDEKVTLELVLQNLAGADMTWALSITQSPATNWITTTSSLNGTLVARQSTTIPIQIDGSKLQIDSSATATLTITHNEPGTVSRTITVHRIPSKTKTRGIPISWLNKYNITADSYEEYDSLVEEDHDNDGMATWEEWHADTAPTNAASVLSLSEIAHTGNITKLTWKGGTTATQIVQYATSLTGNWQDCITNAPPMPITNTLSLPANDNGRTRFYRIVVPLK